MSQKYQEYDRLDLPKVAEKVLEKWNANRVFEASVTSREGRQPFVFFEGPPSANGLPGIHHVMARSIKDIFCRYKTLKGFQVKRKAGWDTHGLPVELGVEKELGITKEDIGKTISVDEYNKACREAVMRYTDIWNRLTEQMGYWVDMNDPYITYEPKYMESVWWLLGELYRKDLMYKGYTIQPYSPAAGTGLSTHELNQPGCYRNVKDTTVVAQFKVAAGSSSPFEGGSAGMNFAENTYFLAWTTTPWTLPSNTALCVGPNIEYVLVENILNQYTNEKISVILAKNCLNAVIPKDLKNQIHENFLKSQYSSINTIIFNDKFDETRLVELNASSSDSKKTAYITDLSNYETRIKNWSEEYPNVILSDIKAGYEIACENLQTVSGTDLLGIRYEQLLPYTLPHENPEEAFRVIGGDFVTTEDGTGIVHIAPTFGADDARVAAEAGVPPMLVSKIGAIDHFIDVLKQGDDAEHVAFSDSFSLFSQIFASGTTASNIASHELSDEEKEELEVYHHKAKSGTLEKHEVQHLAKKAVFSALIGHQWEEARRGNLVPLVDLQGRFRPEVGPWGGQYVKNEYYADGEAPEKSVDVQISIWLKEQNRAFKVEKYEHSYPHCWRTDKPVLYYPLDSWFIRVKNVKDRMVELNNTITWKPESTGTGRFGEWLKNANDWNLSRSRYWGIPIPIWSTEDGSERICISSVEQLKNECEKAVAAGVMDTNPMAEFVPNDFSEENYHKIDLHKNYMDEITLISPLGKPMKRESDLIDVWFDSGSMPYAQWHYPFENKDLIDNGTSFPADFIAEGVDQTRGWFYTLHAIATMVFDNVAYKNVVSNGLVLDKNGQKMSKRLGNAVEPFETLAKYGPDATRWYMITNAQPWDNLKFDVDGITEVQRKLFGTLYNTYSFFALYANIDGFTYSEADIALENRPEIDRWILSKLHSLIAQVDEAYETYEPTKAGRLVQEFVSDQLSNWYVRLCRRRFWKGDYSADKISAYQTLYTCLETVALLASPIAPFYPDQLFTDLNAITGKHQLDSVHLADFPVSDPKMVDMELESQMDIAQRVSSLVLALRKKEKIRVRQPLQKIMVPVLNDAFEKNILHVKELILSEVNVKELELLDAANNVLVKSVKPNFKTIGPKYGKLMKEIASCVSQMGQEINKNIEANGFATFDINGQEVTLDAADIEVSVEHIPGWLVASEGGLTVALDNTISEELRREGIARELINRVQNLRKDSGLEVTDRIQLTLDSSAEIQAAIAQNQDYVCNEVLANAISFGSLGEDAQVIDLLEEGDAKIGLVKA